MLKLTTDKHKASRGLSATAELLVFFPAEGGPIWMKFRRLLQNVSTAVIWLKSKPDVEFQYGGRLGQLHGMSSQSDLPLG